MGAKMYGLMHGGMDGSIVSYTSNVFLTTVTTAGNCLLRNWNGHGDSLGTSDILGMMQSCPRKSPVTHTHTHTHTFELITHTHTHTCTCKYTINVTCYYDSFQNTISSFCQYKSCPITQPPFGVQIPQQHHYGANLQTQFVWR